MSGLQEIGPDFVGFANYATLLKDGDIFKYFLQYNDHVDNGLIPQIIVSLLLAAWFSDPSLRLKFKPFWEAVIYLPNLIMANAAFAMLFATLFSQMGSINTMLMNMHVIKESYDFLAHTNSTRWAGCFHELPYVVRKYNNSPSCRYSWY